MKTTDKTTEMEKYETETFGVHVICTAEEKDGKIVDINVKAMPVQVYRELLLLHADENQQSQSR